MIGPGVCSSGEAEAATRAGRCIAQKGAILLCGGLFGVMEAACLGAREKSGMMVGIIPGLTGENSVLSVTIRSGLGHARNAVLIQSRMLLLRSGETMEPWRRSRLP